MVTGPEATRSTIGMLNTSGVGMSAPVTSTTTVITAVAGRLCRCPRHNKQQSGPVGFPP